MHALGPYAVVAAILGSMLLVLKAGQGTEAAPPVAPGASVDISAAAALFSLAAERYAINRKAGETWILTEHDYLVNTNCMKFKDGELTLVSIPILEPDKAGFCNYIDHYNSFTIAQADQYVQEDKVERAKKIYKLILQFDHCGTSMDSIRDRLKLLSRWTKKESGAIKANKVFHEYDGVVPLPDLSRLSSTPSVTVTNWDNVHIP